MRGARKGNSFICGDGGLRCPEAYLESADKFGKSYKIRLFIPGGEAKMLYTLQPELTKLIMKHFDRVRAPTQVSLETFLSCSAILHRVQGFR